jgi:hypothetical protein
MLERTTTALAVVATATGIAKTYNLVLLLLGKQFKYRV